MKAIYKILTVVMTLPLLAGLTSCTEEAEYDAAKIPAGIQVYFSNELPAQISVSDKETKTSITLSRVVTDKAVTVPLKVETDTELFSFPQSVTFAEGETSAEITVTYDPAKLENGVYADVTLTLDDDTYTTPYGNSSYSFSIGLPESWKEIGYGLYYDDIFATTYEEKPVEYAVLIEENEQKPGMFRLVNPYGENYPYNVEGDWDASQNYYLEIDATDPDHVWFTTQYMGIDWGSGQLYIQTKVDLELEYGSTLESVKENYPELFGKYEDGIITMPTNSIYVYFTGLAVNDGYWWYGNINGLFRIVMPGIEVKDYSVTPEYTGRFIDTNDKKYAVTYITLGKDVEYVKYALVDADLAESTIDGIIDGTIEAEVLRESGELRFPMEETGQYTLVAVSFAGADSKLSGSVKFNFVDTDVKETWTLYATGTYTYSAYFEGEEVLPLYQSDLDPTRFKIAPFGNEGELIFTWNQTTNDCVVQPSNTNYEMEGYGMLNVQELNEFGMRLWNYSYDTSYYYEEESTFWFNVVYYDDTDYYYGFDWESFRIADPAAEAVSAKPRVRTAVANSFGKKRLHRPAGITPKGESSRRR
ncbi:MAG: hypothetical protein NC206_03175 [Bacteroides sp.]|nr:hypothetical protein [Roseburia sp.]MCM1346067.1 hypothetical protein [Bacteroides sp.]MCM1420590.1 hypothetical protein [Bacteroides sp.]